MRPTKTTQGGRGLGLAVAGLALLLLAPACPPAPVPPTADADAEVAQDDASAVNPDAQPQPPPPPPVQDACSAFCAILTQLGCSEGAQANCASTCRHVIDSGLTDLKISCVSAAKTVAQVKACGSVKCVGK